MRTLILGAGHRQIRWLPLVNGALNPSDEWPDRDVTTLDNNARCKPDVLWDLESGVELPWAANTFDEIHAYEVLEHTGSQGDANFFFWQFTDFWRILKPNGHLYGSVPHHESPWALGDPSHKRVIPDVTFVFLDQQEYVKQCDGPERTPMSDFRDIYSGDFVREGLYRHAESLFFDLRARK